MLRACVCRVLRCVVCDGWFLLCMDAPAAPVRSQQRAVQMRSKRERNEQC